MDHPRGSQSPEMAEKLRRNNYALAKENTQHKRVISELQTQNNQLVKKNYELVIQVSQLLVANRSLQAQVRASRGSPGLAAPSSASASSRPATASISPPSNPSPTNIVVKSNAPGAASMGLQPISAERNITMRVVSKPKDASSRLHQQGLQSIPEAVARGSGTAKEGREPSGAWASSPFDDDLFEVYMQASTFDSPLNSLDTPQKAAPAQEILPTPISASSSATSSPSVPHDIVPPKAPQRIPLGPLPANLPRETSPKKLATGTPKLQSPPSPAPPQPSKIERTGAEKRGSAPSTAILHAPAAPVDPFRRRSVRNLERVDYQLPSVRQKLRQGDKHTFDLPTSSSESQRRRSTALVIPLDLDDDDD